MAIWPIDFLRDDFENNVQDPVWASAGTTGSATKAETGGQARFTLPSSTAGSHLAYYRTPATYDFSGDSLYINIQTMVATGVAATAFFYVIYDASNYLVWTQTSGTLKAQTVIAGAVVDRYSVAWSAATYKYLRIGESAGTITWSSSTNGTSWTSRATLANPFPINSMSVQFGALCGNVASPGSFRLDDVNLVLPAPSSTWRETTADWGISNRLQPIVLASDGGKVGVIVTADTMDQTARTLGGTVRYFAGPFGSSSGGYLALTEYASLAAAQTSAFLIPVGVRIDLPAFVDARYMRLYHRSIDASAHTIYEFVPRRVIQAEDIQAESIQAINIAAGAITADKIFVIQLSAITADVGLLTGGVIDGVTIYAGGAGHPVTLDASGLAITIDTTVLALRTLQFKDAGGVLQSSVGGFATSADISAFMTTESLTGKNSTAAVSAHAPSGKSATVSLTSDVVGVSNAQIVVSTTGAGVNTISIGASNVTTTVPGTLNLSSGLNVGTATGATTGQISTSQDIGVGVAANTAIRLFVKGEDSTSATYAFDLQNSSGTNIIAARNDSRLGFFNATVVARPTVTGSRSANAALASLLTGLNALGLVLDSSTV